MVLADCLPSSHPSTTAYPVFSLLQVGHHLFVTMAPTASKSAQQKTKEHPQNQKFKSYFYEQQSKKARGLRVVKCKTDGCYGCCLDGEKRPTSCNRCDEPFDFGIRPPRSASPASDRSEKAQPKAAAKKRDQQQGPSNLLDVNQVYDNLEESGMEHDKILELLKSWKMEYKPKTIASPARLTSSAAAIDHR